MDRTETSGGYFEWENEHVLIFTATIKEAKAEDVISYFDGLETITKKTTDSFILIFDASQAGWMNESVRKLTADMVRDFSKKYPNKVLKRYFVIQNTVVRIMLKAIDILAKHKYKQEIYGTRQGAIDAALDEFQQL